MTSSDFFFEDTIYQLKTTSWMIMNICSKAIESLCQRKFSSLYRAFRPVGTCCIIYFYNTFCNVISFPKLFLFS